MTASSIMCIALPARKNKPTCDLQGNVCDSPTVLSSTHMLQRVEVKYLPIPLGPLNHDSIPYSRACMNCLHAIVQGFANVEVCHAGMPFIQFLALILLLLNSSFMTNWMSGF